jgi:Anti-sigma-K factor rskA/Putative zinc-finger
VSECAEVRELLGGHVLGALEPREAKRVDRHLESCPRCRRERDELAGLPALLDLAGSADAEPEAPPAALEEAVLDRFARERRTLSPREPSARRPRLGGRLRLGLAGAGAVAAVAVALLLSGALSSSDENEAFGHVDLRGGGASAEADLRAVREGTSVDLSVTGLPSGPEPVYELWCIPDRGRWISGGTFRVDAHGRARVRLTSAAKPGDYERIVITSGARGAHVLTGGVVY